MMKKLLNNIIPFLALLICASCSQEKPRYVIGISQCSADIWREKQNAELRMDTYFQDGVELRFAAAYDSDERQIQQIDSLVATGIDLLIVAPNQVQTISPAIDRTYDSGIPVIVFERKTNSRKYTAFMSADNYEMGRQMGEFIASQLGGRGVVMEVKGLKGSSPAIERHNGFADAMKRYPDIRLAAVLDGDWTEESAYKKVKGYEGDLSGVDFVFAQNDRMAMGARKALAERKEVSKDRLIRYCGIDGLPGEGGGIQLVRDSILTASYIYPTHGDQLLQLAVDILDGKPYAKETRLQSALVTRENAEVLLMQAEEMMHQSSYLDQLRQKANTYMHQLDTQRTITLLALGIIVLLIVAIVLFYRYHIGMMTLRRERVVNTLWELKPEEVAPAPAEATPVTDAPSQSDRAEEPEEAAPSEDSSTEQEEKAEPVLSTSASMFIARFKEAVESRLEDSELSVEDLAGVMHLSRVQLYRKVKAVTGSTPVELLRTARLKRGYKLLLTTDKSVSEIAYEVGFTAPSYFTKCFKEEYGQLPGDVRE